MAVGGIEQYGGLYSPYRYNDIPAVDSETVRKQDQLKNSSANNLLEDRSGNAQSTGTSVSTSTSDQNEAGSTADTRSRTADLQNISLTFNKNSDFDFLGQDSGVQSLDMQKAISDMQKDSVLQDYQYFVGSSNNLGTKFSDEDGTVLAK